MSTARWTKHLRLAAWVRALGLVALLICAGSAWAADDEEEGSDPIQTIFGILGLKKSATIDYRERSPLVVPPTRELPPPETAAMAKKNPAWPADLDTKQAAEAAAKRPISDKAQSADDNPEKALSTVAEPADLRNLFSDGFSGAFRNFGSKTDEVATFNAEPPRTSLTAPPAGYQTPSRAAPYGVTKPGEFDRVHKIEEPKPDKY